MCIVVVVIAGNHAVLSSAGSGIIKIISKSKFLISSHHFLGIER